MRQRTTNKEEQMIFKGFYDRFLATCRDSRTGWPVTAPAKPFQEATPEERESVFEDLWERGGLGFVVGSYPDLFTDEEVSRSTYDFWKKKVRERLTDPAKYNLMAPDEPPYFFGTKRVPLEQDYYEMLNEPHVDIVSLKQNPLKQFTETGMLLEDGTHREYDVLVLATGFDSFTGSVTNMGLKSTDGRDMKDCWKDGVCTYLGMTVKGFPNTFMVYSPVRNSSQLEKTLTDPDDTQHAPTALSNGPTILEAQTDFIASAIAKLESQRAKSIEPQQAAQDEWKALIHAMGEMTLVRFTNSWWNAANVPGKKAENMTYMGGVDMYEKTCREKLESFKGFDVVAAELPAIDTPRM